METQGSFGLCLAISANGHFVASGHENGKAYVFSLATGKLLHSLAGLSPFPFALAVVSMPSNGYRAYQGYPLCRLFPGR